MNQAITKRDIADKLYQLAHFLDASASIQYALSKEHSVYTLNPRNSSEAREMADRLLKGENVVD